MFMTTVIITFILNNSTLGFGLAMNVSTVTGILAMLMITGYVIKRSKGRHIEDESADSENKAQLS